MRRAALLLPLLAGLAAWPGAPAADTTAVNGLIQSTDMVGERHGVRVTQSVRRMNGELPPPLNDLELEFPPGTRLGLERFPSCGLARLQVKGPAGCAPRSRVGSGIVRLQVPFRFPHAFAGTLRIFNGEDSRERKLLLYMLPQAGSGTVLVGTWAGSRKAGLRLRIRTAPIVIPEAVPDSIVRLSFRIGARRGAASFLRPPCPGRYRATAHYGDGSVVTSSDRAKCR